MAKRQFNIEVTKMRFWHKMKGALANFWHDVKGGLAGWLLYAIIVVVLIIILVLVLRFLFNVI